MNEKTKPNGLYKRVLSVVLALTVLFLAMPAWNMTARAADDVTLITTAAEFNSLVKGSGNFRLENDITVTTPVSSFSGIFDGNGHTITLNISSSSGNAGLFGEIYSTAVIKNLGVTGSVTSTSSEFVLGVGGIVGHNSGGTVQNCYNSAAVSAASYFFYVGGIVGNNERGIVQNCYNTGSFTGNMAGGIVGQNDSGTIQNCYNIGTFGGDFGNGISGQNIESNDVPSVVEKCYTLDSVPDYNLSEVVNEIAQADFASSSTFSGWDFNDTWVMSSQIQPFARPVLRSCAEGFYDTGSDEYAISNRNGMEMLKDYVNGTGDYSAHTGEGMTFKLTADIDLGGSSWTPIGSWTSSTVYKPFSGTFDGGGHEIKLNISSSNNNQGLFGYVSGGTIKNLGVTGAVDCGSSGSTVGSIVAINSGGTVINCYNKANVTGFTVVGGIVGKNESGGSVKYCYNIGTVTKNLTSGQAGSIIGNPTGSTQPPNNYYLLASGSAVGSTNAFKSEAQFNSGEVAWLLQNGQDGQVWGQTIGTDDYPVLTTDNTKKVCKVVFEVDGRTNSTEFVNYGGTVTLPEVTVEGKELTGWQIDGGSAFTSTTPVTGDITITAVLENETVNPPSLDGTKVTVKKTKNTITVILDPADPNAEFYYVDENGEEVVSKTGEFTDLEPGKDYEIKVRYEGSDGTDAAEVTTVNEDGSTTVKPGETAKTGDTEITNKDGKVTVKDSSGNTTEITNASGDVDLNSDGSVSLPEGGAFTVDSATVIIPEGGTLKPNSNGNVTVSEGTTVTQNGTTMTVDDDATVGTDGSVSFPEGGDVKIGDTTVTVPKGGKVKSESNGNVTVPNGSTVTPPNSDTKIEITDGKGTATVDEDGNVTLPDGGDIEIGDTKVKVPSGETVEPNNDGSVKVPDGSVVTPPNGAPDITVENSNGSNATVDDKGNVDFPNGGSATVGDKEVTLPDDGGSLEPVGDGFVKIPENSTVDGEKLESDGVLDSNGDTYDGAQIIDDVLFIPPEGESVTPNGDGTVSVPEGTTVVPKNGGSYTVESDNGVVDTKDGGSVTFPEGEGEVKVGNTTVTVPEGSTVTPTEDGVTVPKGSTVKGENGNPDITLTDGGTVESDGDITVSEGGQIEIGDTTVTVPEGGTFERNDDGSVTVPDGSKVKNGDTEIEIKDGNGSATVDKDGNVSFPNGGNAEIGGADITVPKNGTIEPQEDGTVLLPEGSTVNGTETTVGEGGGKFDPATGELDESGSDNNLGDDSGSGSGDNSGSTLDPSGDTDTPSMGDNTNDNVNVGTVSVGNAPSVSLDEASSESLIKDAMASLSDEERKAVENGAKLEVILTSELIDSAFSSEDIQTVNVYTSQLDYNVGQHLNISIVKRIGNTPAGAITELSAPIRITLEIPENIRSNGRTYAVVRVHNGEVKLLEDKDNDPKTITIESDKFSTYTIVYKNAKSSDDDDDDDYTESTEPNNSGSDIPGSHNPYTGNEIPGVAAMVLACAAGTAAVVIKKRRTK